MDIFVTQVEIKNIFLLIQKYKSFSQLYKWWPKHQAERQSIYQTVTIKYQTAFVTTYLSFAAACELNSTCGPELPTLVLPLGEVDLVISAPILLPALQEPLPFPEAVILGRGNVGIFSFSLLAPGAPWEGSLGLGLVSGLVGLRKLKVHCRPRKPTQQTWQ